ncbi:Molybdenum cofactor cytidylyltransferase (EC [Olavius algarvensis Delta 1 endosymbiont]|nr:Molybdenum cofactor cytidylyltransferase (EC [Olavius algarvensis Delta 1 endosymbiont]
MPHNRQTAGVILAAGMSRRFGHPKQLIKLQDKHLLEWVLEAALASCLAKIVLVLGHAHEQIRLALDTAIERPRLQIVINRRYSEGQSRSLQAGLKTVHKSFDSVMFLLGDQPRLKPGTIDLLLAHFWNSNKNICVPVQAGVRGNPTLFSRRMYGELMAIRGDIGARRVIAENPDQVLAVETGDPTEFIDIDSPADLLKFD